MWDRDNKGRPLVSGKEEKRYTLDRMTRYYQEAGHSKTYARLLAKNYLKFGKK